MFNHMDGVMRALPNKKAQWKEDLHFTMKFAQQKLSKWYAEVTPMVGILPFSAHILDISKMYFSHWAPPGVSERMWSVNIKASISWEYQTLGGHSGRPCQYLGSLMTGTGVPWEWLWWVCKHLGVLERTLSAPGSVAKPLQESQANSEKCLGSMYINSEDCRHDQIYSRCTQAINFTQRRIWCTDYCSLSHLNHTSYHLLQQCIFCLAALRNQRKMWVFWI